jgi:hypothetical protein
MPLKVTEFFQNIQGKENPLLNICSFISYIKLVHESYNTNSDICTRT